MKGRTMKFNNVLAQEAFDLINNQAKEEIEKLNNSIGALPLNERFQALVQITSCKIIFLQTAIKTAIDIETETANTLADISKITANLPD
jgi:hypothetical protein